jgi:predicted amidohydrolase
VIAADGTISGRHRKINALKMGSEAWSSPGEQAVPVPVPPFSGVGLLICADAYTLEISKSLKAQGAQVLISPAAWAPGFHGPSGEWEQCTLETGLPLFVCNRTGPDRLLDFSKAESTGVKNGQRLVSFTSIHSAVLLIDWDMETQAITRQESLKITM